MLEEKRCCWPITIPGGPEKVSSASLRIGLAFGKLSAETVAIGLFFGEELFDFVRICMVIGEGRINLPDREMRDFARDLFGIVF